MIRLINGACFSTTMRIVPIISPLRKQHGMTITNIMVVFPPLDFGPMHPKNMPKEMLQALLMTIVSRERSGRCAIWMPSTFTMDKNARIFRMDSNKM